MLKSKKYWLKVTSAPEVTVWKCAVYVCGVFF